MGNLCSKGTPVVQDRDRPQAPVVAPKSKIENTRATFDPDPDGRATAYNVEAQDREKLIGYLEGTRLGATTTMRPVLVKQSKRKKISAIPLDEYESLSFRAASYPKSEEVSKFLLEVISGNFIFNVIDGDTKREFVDAFEEVVFAEGEWVMHKGRTEDYFCIVAEGSVAFYDEEAFEGQRPSVAPYDTGSKGTTFGELSLLYNQAQDASILASTPLILYRVDQHTFRSLIMSHKVHDRSDTMSLLKENSIFKDLTDDQLRKLADAFTLVYFKQGERIVNKGDEGNILYIVKSGEVNLHNIGHGHSKYDDVVLKAGEYFGEKALFENETRGRAANVTSVSDSLLLAISKKTLEGIIGPIEQAIKHASRAKTLSSIPLMRGFKDEEIIRCEQLLKEVSFNKDDNIPVKGMLYLIQEGEALMTRHDIVSGGKDGECSLVRIKEGDYFGNIWWDDSVDQEHLKFDQYTINAETALSCLVLSASDVQSVIGDLERMSVDGEPIEPRSRSSWLKFRQMNMTMFQEPMVKSTKRVRKQIRLRDLKNVRMLGTGTFGKVWLVTPTVIGQDGSKPNAFALKTISKRVVLKSNLVAAVLREKNVLESIQHPFLLSLVQTFQDKDNLYLMLDLVLGGELFDLLYKKSDMRITTSKSWPISKFYSSFGPEVDTNPDKGVAVRKAVFYSACVIDAFAHLYNRRIVYRDLKPENIMLDSKGYCVIVDMGFAKIVLDKTYTMCGTPEYISPEVILNIGHNHSADHWSFGCLLYELIAGKTPFYVEHSMGQMALMKRIVKADYQFPEICSEISPQSRNLDSFVVDWKDLTSRLLVNNSSERLGNLSGGIGDITGHGWFEKVDFNELRNQQIPAPWLPNVKDPLDPSNYTNGDADEGNEFFPTELSDEDQMKFKLF